MLYRFSISILVFGMLIGIAPTDALALEAEWQQLINGISIGQVWALDGSAHRLYAGSSEGVFRSENNGQTWGRIGFDTQDPFDNSVAALTVDRNSVYVGTWSSGLFRSELSFYKIFNYILYVLHTGIQWNQLRPRRNELHGSNVYKWHSRWSKDGSYEKLFEASVMHLLDTEQLDTSRLHGDGSNTVVKKRVMPQGI